MASSVKVFHQLMAKTFRDERKFQIFILESSIDFIPRGMKKPIYKEYLKDQLIEKYGPDSFLIPEEKLFPVININTGMFDSRLIQYALIRSLALKRISHSFDYIYDKALKCFKDHNCKDTIEITILSTGEKIGLIQFLTNYDNLDGKKEFDIPDDAEISIEEIKQLPHYKKHFKKYKRI